MLEIALASDNYKLVEVGITLIGTLMSKEDAITSKIYDSFSDMHVLISQNILNKVDLS